MEDKKPRPILKKLKTLIQGDNSNRVKKNASGGKTYKSRGKGTDGSSLRSKLKTRGENGEITSLSVKREKGLFGGKKKTRVSAKPVEMLSEKGSAFGMNVKKKTITKAPGILGKRTVKRETKFVESPKSKMEGSYESAQEKPQYLAQNKKSPALNTRMNISGSDLRNSQRDLKNKNNDKKDRMMKSAAEGLAPTSIPFRKKTYK